MIKIGDTIKVTKGDKVIYLGILEDINSEDLFKAGVVIERI